MKNNDTAMGEFEAAIKNGRKVLTTDGYNIEVVKYDLRIGEYDYMLAVVRDAGGDIIRTSIFDKDTGFVILPCGNYYNDNGYDLEIIVENYEGWFFISPPDLEIANFYPPGVNNRMFGVFETKEFAEAYQRDRGLTGKIEKIMWVE
jgi:hypothetical protein